jgi:hypothetical protein
MRLYIHNKPTSPPTPQQNAATETQRNWLLNKSQSCPGSNQNLFQGNVTKLREILCSPRRDGTRYNQSTIADEKYSALIYSGILYFVQTAYMWMWNRFYTLLMPGRDGGLGRRTHGGRKGDKFKSLTLHSMQIFFNIRKFLTEWQCDIGMTSPFKRTVPPRYFAVCGLRIAQITLKVDGS